MLDTLIKAIKAIKEGSKMWGGREKDASFMGCEMAGEAGEVCNEIKKLERHKGGMVGGKVDRTGLEDEMGDLLISALIIADHYDLDIVECARRKFNKTSEKHGFDIRVGE